LLAFAGFALAAGTEAALPFAAGLAASLSADFALGFSEVLVAAFAAGFAAGFAAAFAAGFAAAFVGAFAAVLAAGFAVDFVAGLAGAFEATLADALAAGLAAGFTAGFTAAFVAGFVAGFAADLAAGLAEDFAAGFADLDVEAVMTGVSLALVFFDDEVLSAAERRRLDSKPPRFLPVPVSESFFANFMPLDAPTEPATTVSGITKTHVKSSFSRSRLGLVAIIAVNMGSYAYLPRLIRSEITTPIGRRIIPSSRNSFARAFLRSSRNMALPINSTKNCTLMAQRKPFKL
jgi:hypothetical protein